MLLPLPVHNRKEYEDMYLCIVPYRELWSYERSSRKMRLWWDATTSTTSYTFRIPIQQRNACVALVPTKVELYKCMISLYILGISERTFDLSMSNRKYEKGTNRAIIRDTPLHSPPVFPVLSCQFCYSRGSAFSLTDSQDIHECRHHLVCLVMHFFSGTLAYRSNMFRRIKSIWT